MLPLATDADVHGAVVRGLRRRVPGLDLVRAQDVGLRTAADAAVLEWAAAEGRVLISQDKSTMADRAWERVAAGLPMPGVVVIRRHVTISTAINELEIIATCGAPEDFNGLVRFLPL